jgi:hypothetical protein
VSGVSAAGSFRALHNLTELAWDRILLADVPVLVLGLLFLAAAPYHLLLYLRRRQQRGHLWFGLLALAFAANTIASSYWVYQVTDRFDIAVRASDLTGHVAALLAIQFLWVFFSAPPVPALPWRPRPVRRLLARRPPGGREPGSPRVVAGAAPGRGGGPHPP